MSRVESAVRTSPLQRGLPQLPEQTAGDGRLLSLERQLQAWSDPLDRLESSLQGDDVTRVDVMQEALLQLAGNIRDGAVVGNEEYPRLLKRLVDIYSLGVGHARMELLTRTAADYASVIEAASIAYPAYDYSAAVGQLLCYMGQLYHTRRASWKMVFDHILSMPESLEAMRQLHAALFDEIRQWADEGVANLFDIRRDHLELIDELERSLASLDAGIGEARRRLPEDLARQSVVHIADLKRRRALDDLLQRRQRLVLEIDGKRKVLGLVDENIDEFEAKLKDVRRSYLVRLIQGQ